MRERCGLWLGSSSFTSSTWPGAASECCQSRDLLTAPVLRSLWGFEWNESTLSVWAAGCSLNARLWNPALTIRSIKWVGFEGSPHCLLYFAYPWCCTMPWVCKHSSGPGHLPWALGLQQGRLADTLGAAVCSFLEKQRELELIPDPPRCHCGSVQLFETMGTQRRKCLHCSNFWYEINDLMLLAPVFWCLLGSVWRYFVNQHNLVHLYLWTWLHNLQRGFPTTPAVTISFFPCTTVVPAVQYL